MMLAEFAELTSTATDALWIDARGPLLSSNVAQRWIEMAAISLRECRNLLHA